jgi:hypothetical protein
MRVTPASNFCTFFSDTSPAAPRQKIGAQHESPHAPCSGQVCGLLRTAKSFKGFGAFFVGKRGSAEHPQDGLKSTTDDDVDSGEEDGSQSRQNEHHHGGQHHFAAGRPDNFRDFRANLLNELKRIGRGHGMVS